MVPKPMGNMELIMADEAGKGIFRFVVPVRLAFVDLYIPRAFGPKAKPKGEPKYGAWLLLDPEHPELKAFKTKLAEIAKAKWPGAQLSELSFPLKLGNKVRDDHNAKLVREGKSPDTKYDFCAGKVIVPAKSQFQPNLGFVANGQLIELTDDALKAANKSKFYAGVEALAEVNLVAFNRTRPDDKDGVTAYLNGVVSLGRGERIASSGSGLAESFSGYLGQASETNPLNDDEIQF